MARARYRLSRQATVDLREIADYIVNRNPASAKHVMNALHETFKFIGRNPEVGAERDDLHPGLRLIAASKPANSYIVCFYPVAEGVEISDVIHAARDWPEMFATGER